MRWSPAVTVAAVIRRHDRFLMVEEQPEGTSVINQPAGHLESGETLLQAVQREVLEETGRQFVASGLVGIYQWPFSSNQRSYLRFCFCGDVSEPDPGRVLDSDITATHWMRLDQIEADQPPTRSPLVVQCIRDSLLAKPLPLGVLHAVA